MLQLIFLHGYTTHQPQTMIDFSDSTILTMTTVNISNTIFNSHDGGSDMDHKLSSFSLVIEIFETH